MDRRGYELGCWHLDHDHKTGEFRGYLYMNCNMALGKFMDDPEILSKACHEKWCNGTQESQEQVNMDWAHFDVPFSV